MMKSIFALSLVFSLLLIGNLSYARKDVGEYWKNMMKGQPMPEPIKDLIHHQDPLLVSADAGGKERFVRDFDIKPNVILYHTRAMSKQHKKHKSFANNIEEKFKKPVAMVEQIFKMG